jgi:hypothetical protein
MQVLPCGSLGPVIVIALFVVFIFDNYIHWLTAGATRKSHPERTQREAQILFYRDRGKSKSRHGCPGQTALSVIDCLPNT